MKHLRLQPRHEALGATFGEFAGYHMPLYYTKPIEEHHAVRRGAGVFDISHMGQFVAEGPGTLDFLQYALTNNVRPLADGAALYSPICREDGGVLDDLIVYRVNAERFRIIVNAGNHAKDFTWLQGLAGRFDVTLTDRSPGLCLLAVQGPEALGRLASHMAHPPGALGYYTHMEGEAFGVPVFVARTGYTGEPGVELAVPSDAVETVWDGLLNQLNMTPIGLAARDSLRLEACMALYGHELRETWHPLESGVGWAVDLDGADDFCGKAALTSIRQAGVTHRLVGFEMVGRGIARSDYPVVADGQAVGTVTSGVMSPTTGKAVGLAHVPAALAKLGTPLTIEIRGKAVEARVAPRPFYKNPALKG